MKKINKLLARKVLDQPIVGVLVLICFFINPSFGQYGETIRSGRPGFNIGPNTVGARVVQGQVGILAYGANRSEGGNKVSEGYGGIGVFRWGLTEPFEIGLGLGFLDGLRFADSSQSEVTGINLVSLRARYNILEGKGVSPAIGIQINLDLPWLGEGMTQSEIAPRITFITGQSFGKSFRFISNWIIFWNGIEPTPRGWIILHPEFKIMKNLWLFLEGNFFFIEQDVEVNLNGGFSFYFNKDLMWDFSFGYDQTNNGTNDWFLSTGLSYRIRYN